MKRIPKGLQGDITRPGMNTPPQPAAESPDAAGDPLDGLELTDIELKPLSWFTENPENAVFQDLKTPEYMNNLQRDIEEAGAIINPLIAMPDGLLIEGHSRLTVARNLQDAGKALDPGRNGQSRLPVRIITSKLEAAEITKRLLLGNLTRFEIDTETRDLLLARAWPEYFTQEPKGGRPKKGDMMSPFPNRKEIAEQTGVSERQIKRTAATTRRATEIAEESGEQLDRKHLQQAKQERKPAAPPKPPETDFTLEAEAPGLESDFTTKETEAGRMLAGWIGNGSPSYIKGVEQCLVALSTAGVITQQQHQAITQEINQ